MILTIVIVLAPAVAVFLAAGIPAVAADYRMARDPSGPATEYDRLIADFAHRRLLEDGQARDITLGAGRSQSVRLRSGKAT